MEVTKVANTKFPILTLPKCSLQLREHEDRQEVLDIIRERYVALTPEEWVRQHVVHYLAESLHYPQELMQVEGTIELNGMVRRCDVVVYSRNAKPVMIVECKKPEVSINQKVVDQACRYNTVLNVPYLYITNGMQHLVLQVDAEHHKLVQLKELPSWDLLNLEL